LELLGVKGLMEDCVVEKFGLVFSFIAELDGAN